MLSLHLAKNANRTCTSRILKTRSDIVWYCVEYIVAMTIYCYFVILHCCVFWGGKMQDIYL